MSQTYFAPTHKGTGIKGPPERPPLDPITKAAHRQYRLEEMGKLRRFFATRRFNWCDVTGMAFAVALMDQYGTFAWQAIVGVLVSSAISIAVEGREPR